VLRAMSNPPLPRRTGQSAAPRFASGTFSKGFRRLKAFRQLWGLRAALAAHYEKEKTTTLLPKSRRPLNVVHGQRSLHGAFPGQFDGGQTPLAQFGLSEEELACL
jgi:hypothetical protein